MSSRRVRKGPGRRPMSDKRQQFLKLLARGWTPAAARREVGISRSTSRNWRNGIRVRRKDGTVRFVPPLDPLTITMISSRFLSEAERIEIADRHQTGETVRAIAAAIARLRPSAANCAATAPSPGDTTPLKPTEPPHSGVDGRGPPNLLPILNYSHASKSFSRNAGAHHRSAAHCAVSSSNTLTGIWHQRRSIRSSTGPTACYYVGQRPHRCAPAAITDAPTCA